MINPLGILLGFTLALAIAGAFKPRRPRNMGEEFWLVYSRLLSRADWLVTVAIIMAVVTGFVATIVWLSTT